MKNIADFFKIKNLVLGLLMVNAYCYRWLKTPANTYVSLVYLPVLVLFSLLIYISIDSIDNYIYLFLLVISVGYLATNFVLKHYCIAVEKNNSFALKESEKLLPKVFIIYLLMYWGIVAIAISILIYYNFQKFDLHENEFV